MALAPDDFLIEPSTNNDLLFYPKVDGERKGMGLIPRDLNVDPIEMFDTPDKIIKIPKSEWSDRIKDQERTFSRLSDIRNRAMNSEPFPALDQNGQGYCWCYSSTGCVMLARAIANQPYKRLCAHALAWVIKNGRDEGGWCGQSLKGYKERGCPTIEKWPEKSMAGSTYNKPETWEEAKQYMVTEEYADLSRQAWDMKLDFDMVASCCLQRIPLVGDFNWWGHSVCIMDLVEIEPGAFGLRILNSWADAWGTKGTGVLSGGKEKPDGAIAIRTATAA